MVYHFIQSLGLVPETSAQAFDMWISMSWGQTLWESVTDLASAGVYYIDLASAGVYYIWAVADSNYDVLTLHDLKVKSIEEIRRYMT